MDELAPPAVEMDRLHGNQIADANKYVILPFNTGNR